MSELITHFSGVYSTSLGPETSTKKLVGNNWDDLKPPPALVKEMKAKTEWVVGKCPRAEPSRSTVPEMSTCTKAT